MKSLLSLLLLGLHVLTREGRLFNNLEEQINEPTHIRDDGSQSCIDLICTDQPY